MTKNEIGTPTLSSFKTYNKATIKRWCATKSPEMNPYISGKMIFGKGAKIIQWGKNCLFNYGAGTAGESKKNIFLFTPMIIYLKWMKDKNGTGKLLNS